MLESALDFLGNGFHQDTIQRIKKLKLAHTEAKPCVINFIADRDSDYELLELGFSLFQSSDIL